MMLVATTIVLSLSTILGVGTDDLLKLGLQFGFNGLLILLLFGYILQRDRSAKEERLAMIKAIEDERIAIARAIEEHAAALDRNTRGLINNTLSLAYLPPQFRNNADDLKSEIPQRKR